MRDNEFDGFFRNRLSEHVSEVPADMWESVRLKKEKDRKAILLWWSGVFGSLLLFTALVGGYFLYNGHSSGSAPSKKAVRSPTAMTHQYRANSSAATQPDPGNSQPLSMSSRTVIPAVPEPQRYRSSHGGATYKNASQSRKIHNHPHLTGFDAKTSSEQQIQSRSIVSAPPTIQITDETFSIETEPVSLLLIEKRLPLQGSASLTSQSKESHKSIPAKPRQNWFLGAYLSPDMPFNVVHSNDPALAQQMKNNQKMELSFTAGLEIGKTFGKHFSAETGIQYSDIKVKVPMDSGFSYLQDHFRSIDIPVIAGYALGNNNFSSIIKTGFVVNAYSWYKGVIITDTGGVTDINKSGYYKHFTGISLQFGVDLTKRVTPNLQLFAGPYFRYRLSSMTRTDPPLPFTQKINVSGLTLGVRYNFRKTINALTQTRCPATPY